MCEAGYGWRVPLARTPGRAAGLQAILVLTRDGNAPGHGALGRAGDSYGMAIAKPDGLFGSPSNPSSGMVSRHQARIGL